MPHRGRQGLAFAVLAWSMIAMTPAPVLAGGLCGTGGADPWAPPAAEPWRAGTLRKNVTLHVGEWSRSVVPGIDALVVVVRPPTAAPARPQPRIVYAPGARPRTAARPARTVAAAAPRAAAAPAVTTVGALPGALALPIAGAPITSGFGWRIHPILGYRKFHFGVDFGAPRGTPVRSAAAGLVEACGREAAEGNFVRLRHDGRTVTLYAHLDRFAGLRQGQMVSAGEVIAFVGSTGLSTGPHLYYEVRLDGRAVDPIGAPAPADDPDGTRRPLLVQAP